MTRSTPDATTTTPLDLHAVARGLTPVLALVFAAPRTGQLRLRDARDLAGREVLQAEIEAAGFRLREEITLDGLDDNYVLRFERM